MSNLPLVSIIVPSYNHSKYVAETINSIMASEYKNVQLIVIDDNSTDNSVEIITALQLQYGFEFYQQENQGLSKTLNNGLFKYAKGEFYCYLASDDKMLPQKFTTLINAFEKAYTKDKNIGAIYSDGYIINEDSRRKRNILVGNPRPLVGSVANNLAFFNWIPAMAIMYRTDYIKDIGGFDPALKIEDYDLLIRFAEKYKIIFVDEKLVEYRVHSANTSKNKELMWSNQAKIYAKHPHTASFRNFQKSLKQFQPKAFLKELSFRNLNILFCLVVNGTYKKIRGRGF